MVTPLLALLFSVALCDLAELKVHTNAIPDEFIVVYKDVELESFLLDVKSFTSTIPARNIQHVYQHAVKGFTAQLSAEQLADVRANPMVAYVEMNQIVSLDATCSPTIHDVESWGLTRIAQKDQDLNGNYAYPTKAGENVDVYIVDTGIYIAHEDFGGRATFGFKAQSSWQSTDDNGHGTHVASTTVGLEFGVAKHAQVIAVKVLNGPNGQGTTAGVVSGIDWVISQHETTGKKSVINMSLGGGYSTTLNTAVNAAVKAGIATFVAAGNENSNACDGSPSSASEVLAVGATSQDPTGNKKDLRASYSNFGPCVGVFAPGSLITGAWIGGPKKTNTISGTSMATPHVTGIGALLFSENPSWDAYKVQSAIVEMATKDKIDLGCAPTSVCGKTENLLAWNGCIAGQ